jgi:hypothetical protein
MRNNRIEAIGYTRAEAKQHYQAEVEVQNFLKAINSYAERFAQNPELSFDDHLFTIAAQSETPHFA